MHLPGHQHRIDGDADVTDRGVTHPLADAGFRIDLDFADMGAVRPARAVDLAFAVDAEFCAILFFRDLEQPDALVGADHRKPAVAIRSWVHPAPAVPPTNSEREPTLPKPMAKSVSPCTTSILSMGTPSEA